MRINKNAFAKGLFLLAAMSICTPARAVPTDGYKSTMEQMNFDEPGKLMEKLSHHLENTQTKNIRAAIFDHFRSLAQDYEKYAATKSDDCKTASALKSTASLLRQLPEIPALNRDNEKGRSNLIFSLQVIHFLTGKSAGKVRNPHSLFPEGVEIFIRDKQELSPTGDVVMNISSDGHSGYVTLARQSIDPLASNNKDDQASATALWTYIATATVQMEWILARKMGDPARILSIGLDYVYSPHMKLPYWILKDPARPANAASCAPQQKLGAGQ